MKYSTLLDRAKKRNDIFIEKLTKNISLDNQHIYENEDIPF